MSRKINKIFLKKKRGVNYKTELFKLENTLKANNAQNGIFSGGILRLFKLLR